MSTVKERLQVRVTIDEIYIKSESLAGMPMLKVIETGIKTHEKLIKVAKDKEVRERFRGGLDTLKAYKSMVKSGEVINDRNQRALVLLVATSLWYWEGE